MHITLIEGKAVVALRDVEGKILLEYEEWIKEQWTCSKLNYQAF